MKYLLGVLVLFVTLLSCQKVDNTEDTPTSPTPPPTTVDTVPAKKELVLTYVSDNSGYYSDLKIEYDSNRRVTKWDVPSEYKAFYVYYKDDTIHHAICTYLFNGMYTRSSAIFLYRPDKRCYKVVYKKPLDTYNLPVDQVLDDNNPYYSNSTDGQFIKVDSLVYSASNQLTELWYIGQTNPALHQFVYTDQQKTVPEKVLTYDLDDQGNKKLIYEVAITTNDVEQPGHRFLVLAPFLSKLGLVAGHSHVVDLPTVINNTSADSRSLMVLVPKCITNLTTHYYGDQPYVEDRGGSRYEYSADSSSFVGRYEGGGISFRYTFEKL
jgi:hypothetical protein